MRKAQIMWEYIFAMFTAMLLLIIFTSAISGEITDKTDERDRLLLSDVGKAAQTEIYKASSMEPGYERTFELPDDLDGSEYSVDNTPKQIIVKTDEYDLAYTIPEIKGTVQKGQNLLRNIAGIICVGNVTCADTIAPVVTSVAPSGMLGYSDVTLNVTTDEDSICRYSLTNQDYVSMTGSMDGEGVEHLEDLSLGNASYVYYVRCRDPTGNAMNDSSLITFTVST